MSKSMMIRFAALFLLVSGLLGQAVVAAAQHGSAAVSKFPVACYFFEPAPQHHSGHAVEEGTAKSRAYEVSLQDVYRLWCTTNESTPAAKEKAADAMVNAWQHFWDEDEPYDAVFHEDGAFDLLALLGVTHHLPAAMVADTKLTLMWMEACNDSCFTINGDLEGQAGQKAIIMQLWLRNDVLSHLKREPASEPVIEMLDKALFRLVN